MENRQLDEILRAVESAASKGNSQNAIPSDRTLETGSKSSEFRFAVFVAVLGLALIAAGISFYAESPELGADLIRAGQLLAVGSAGTYAISRGQAKLGAFSGDTSEKGNKS